MEDEIKLAEQALEVDYAQKLHELEIMEIKAERAVKTIQRAIDMVKFLKENKELMDSLKAMNKDLVERNKRMDEKLANCNS